MHDVIDSEDASHQDKDKEDAKTIINVSFKVVVKKIDNCHLTRANEE